MKILTFGIVREIVGGGAIDIAVGKVLTVTELKGKLCLQYPELSKLSSFMIAVDGEYIAGDTMIREEGEVAIIPPVSGG